MGYMHHQRCEIARRSVRVKLADRGRQVRKVVIELFERHADGLQNRGGLEPEGSENITSSLKWVERY